VPCELAHCHPGRWNPLMESIWPEIFLQYILIPLSAKISIYKCQSAHSVVWHTSPDHYSKLLPTQFVYAFLIPFLSGFSLNVYMLISHNLHFAYISKYNCVSVPNERQVQYASAPGQSVFFCFDTQSNCLPNHPSLVTFLATSTSYSMLRHSSRSSLMKHTCNFVQMHISTFFDILELCPLRPRQQIGGLPVRSWFATEPHCL